MKRFMPRDKRPVEGMNFLSLPHLFHFSLPAAADLYNTASPLQRSTSKWWHHWLALAALTACYLLLYSHHTANHRHSCYSKHTYTSYTLVSDTCGQGTCIMKRGLGGHVCRVVYFIDVGRIPFSPYIYLLMMRRLKVAQESESWDQMQVERGFKVMIPSPLFLLEKRSLLTQKLVESENQYQKLQVKRGLQVNDTFPL